jgi:hypothetical protein
MMLKINGSEKVDVALPELRFGVLFDGPDNKRHNVAHLSSSPTRYVF